MSTNTKMSTDTRNWVISELIKLQIKINNECKDKSEPKIKSHSGILVSANGDVREINLLDSKGDYDHTRIDRVLGTNSFDLWDPHYTKYFGYKLRAFMRDDNMSGKQPENKMATLICKRGTVCGPMFLFDTDKSLDIAEFKRIIYISLKIPFYDWIPEYPCSVLLLKRTMMNDVVSFC